MATDPPHTAVSSNVASKATWLRGLFMLVFAVIYQVAEAVVFAVAVFQFLAVLFTGRPNTRLLEFGQSLSRFVYDTMRFFMFATEDKPFPLSPWPSASSSKTPPPAGVNPEGR